MAPSQRRSSFVQFLLIFALVYVGSQLLLQFLYPDGGRRAPGTAFELTMVDGRFSIGHHPELLLQNLTQAEVRIPARCPHPPVDVFVVDWAQTASEALSQRDSTETVLPCPEIPPVPPGESQTISLAPWKYSLFERVGTYEVHVRLPAVAGTASGMMVQGNEQTMLTARFEITEPGPFTKVFRTFITKPLLGGLIFIASILPGHDLAVAIILLTLLVKLLLFLPTQHAMEGQKKMQLLQPKIEALKKKYGHDKRLLQEETMKLWKEHNINPFSACLPTLIQLPVLIGLFYVVRDGGDLSLSRHLIYPAYQDLSWTFDPVFLGLHLLQPSIFLMPPLLAALQFLQMKLAFAVAKRKKAGEDVIDVGKEKEPASPQEMQQKVMLYGLPLMIGFFALQFPAAVSLYWGVSTIFGIVQQLIVNREHLRV